MRTPSQCLAKLNMMLPGHRHKLASESICRIVQSIFCILCTHTHTHTHRHTHKHTHTHTHTHTHAPVAHPSACDCTGPPGGSAALTRQEQVRRARAGWCQPFNTVDCLARQRPLCQVLRYSGWQWHATRISASQRPGPGGRSTRISLSDRHTISTGE